MASMQPQDGAPQRGFAAAGLAHDAERLALRPGKADVVHGVEMPPRGLKIFFQMFDLQAVRYSCSAPLLSLLPQAAYLMARSISLSAGSRWLHSGVAQGQRGETCSPPADWPGSGIIPSMGCRRCSSLSREGREPNRPLVYGWSTWLKISSSVPTPRSHRRT